jgi:hypothetical protein
MIATHRFTKISIFIAIIGLFLFSSVARAQTVPGTDTTTGNTDGTLANDVVNTVLDTPNTPTDNTASTSSDNNTAVTAPSEATTTPEVVTPTTPSSSTQTNNEAAAGANQEYTQKLDSILNQSITPKTQPKPKTEKKATPITTGVKPSNIASTSLNATTKATTIPPDGTVKGAVDEFSNYAPVSNYYVPLDSLSPEMTYSLSGIAMILGILGAILIIRDPQEAIVWTPGIQTQEPLLKP